MIIMCIFYICIIYKVYVYYGNIKVIIIIICYKRIKIIIWLFKVFCKDFVFYIYYLVLRDRN